MAQAIVTVLILLIVIVYAVFFSLWNAGTIPITGLVWMGQELGHNAVPVFLLPLAGVLIGAIVMAIAIAAPWSSLKSKLAACQDQLDAERARSSERARKLEALNKRLQKAQQETHPTPQPGEDETPEDLSPPEDEE